MTLTFLPQWESFSIEFEPEAHPVGHNIGFDPETHHTVFDPAAHPVSFQQETCPISFQPDNHVLDAMGAKTHQQGSRKAPLPAKHFFAEVRLNPSKRLLLLRPQSRLTRFASDWVLKGHNPTVKTAQAIYIVECADRFARDIYKLMDWDNRFSYTVAGLTASPSFVSAMSSRSIMGDLTTDTVHVGDYYFNLNHAIPTTQP